MLNAPFFRWFLATASATGAIALGFFILPSSTALKVVQYGGYYFIFAAVVAFAVVAFREYRRDPGAGWTAYDWRLTAVSVFVALIWQFNEIHGFKVLMDELVLSATAMTMHFDRHVFVPMKAHDIAGEFVVFGGVLDKRPLFFPFLLSLLHDLTGYRPGNVFVLNGILSAFLLMLVGRLGRLVSGSEGAGLLAVLLLAGVPLLGLNATGGGFDLLNIVMICVLILLGTRFLRKPSPGAQDLLLLGTVLLAQTRYESTMFVAATAALLLFAWWQEGKPRFSWGLVATPLLLLTIPLQNKLFTVNAGYWASGMDEPPFAPKYFLGNLGHAVNFFYSVDGLQSGSPLLATSGIVCTLFALLFMFRRWKQTLAAPEQTAFLAVGVVIVANSIMVLFYFWGQLDDFVATRLVLPMLVLFALSSAFVLGRWFKARMPWFQGAAAMLVVWFWIFGVPFAAKANSTQTFLSFQEVKDQMEFVAPGQAASCLSCLVPCRRSCNDVRP
jgi:hypothetical protein